MNLSARDRRALLLLAAAVAVVLVLRFAWLDDSAPVAAPAAQVSQVPLTEKRLLRTRELIAQAPELESRLGVWKGALETRESRLIRAATAAQAQESILAIVRRLAGAQAPPIELSSVDPGQIQPFGPGYGEAIVGVSFVSPIESVVNLLAELSRQPEMLATRDLRVTLANEREKTVNVRLTVSGLVPGALVPQRRGGPGL
jgi:hypothetical protein